MKHLLFTFIILFCSIFSFSQVITFECNNEIIIASFDQIANNPNAYIDWNGDNLIDEQDYIIYLSQIYDCDEIDCDENLQDCNEYLEGCYNDNGGYYEIADVMLYDECNGMICESANNWISYVVPGCEEENESITFECNNEIITVSYTEYANNLNANIDWNEDGVINNDDLLIYLNQIYGCNNNDEFEWNTIEWEDSNWLEYDWENVWVDLDLGSIINWTDIPWDDIINLNISPDDLINYINGMPLSQPFDWNNFISSQGCVDDDSIISIGLSIWTDIDGCADALLYLESQNLDCNSPLNLKFVSADPIALSEICCETCQNTTTVDDCCINPDWIDPLAMCFALWDPVIGCDGIQYSNSCVAENAGVTSWTNQMGDEVVIDWDCTNTNNELEGCTEPNACNYDPLATIDDGSCANEINPGILEFSLQPLCYSESIDIAFLIPPSGGDGNYNYQWEISTDMLSWLPLTGASLPSYQYINSNNSSETLTIQIRCRINNNSCSDYVYTSPVNIATLSGLNAGELMGIEDPICYNESTLLSFDILPSGSVEGLGNYTFQWQVSQSGGTFEDIPLANASTYLLNNNNLTSESITNYYRVVVTSNYCGSSIITNIISVDLLPLGTGCSDPDACNYDYNSNDCFNTSNCDYGVQCFVSPCSISEDPGVFGAYCVDDYCEGCCAVWYFADGSLLSNSCDISIKEHNNMKNHFQITDLLGRDNKGFKYEIKIFNDGTVEKKYFIDNE